MSNDDATEQITLDELIGIALEARMAEVHTALPAVVTEYDRSAGTVGVTVPISRMIPDGSGNFVAEPYPALKDIRIEWPGCGKFLITWPLEKGDEGVLVICQHNLGPWRTAGDAVEAGDTAMHTLDGAVFRPAPLTDGKTPTTASASNMVIGSTTDTKGRVALKPAGLELGEGATEAVLKGTSVATATSTLAAALQTLNTAIGTFATAVGAATPAVAPAAVTLNTAIVAAATAISTYNTNITNAKSASTTVL